MMTEYAVSVDVSYTVEVTVDAENEAEAELLAIKKASYITGRPEDQLSIYDIEEN